MGREIKQKDDAGRFYVDVNDDEQAELIYRKVDEQTLDLRHTFVPKEARGKGLGARLASHALEYARDNEYRVVATCSFVRDYLDEHPEYQDLVE